jgi:predicted nucleotidyltransferase
VDHTNPLAVVTPTLDGPVLNALAATTGAATGAHVQRLAGVGSPDGVRRVLARLVGQGVVLFEEHAHATLYRLNREHVAVPAIIELTRLRARIVELIGAEIADWRIQPSHASLFGSFARGQADVDSDIDVLLVANPPVTSADDWIGQVDRLAGLIFRWTGNHAHIVDATQDTLIAMLRNDDPLITSWRADAVHLSGQRIMDLLRSLRPAAGLELKGLA